MPTDQPRLLCLFSAPLVGPDGSPLASLDTEAELDAIVRALAACGLSVTLRLGFATTDELDRGIADGFNILHLSGHGHPDFLVFEDGQGGSHAVTGDYLKRLVATGGPFELAIVSACHSERIGGMLAESGVHHVVAIHCEQPVLDGAAIAFIGQFLRHIFSGDSPEKSLELARLLVEGNPQLAAMKPQLQASAAKKGKKFVPEEDKFVLLPKNKGKSHPHLTPLVQRDSVKPGQLAIEQPRRSRTNLPGRPTSFTGRSLEMYAAINELLASPLVTIKGAGGIGKTTVAIEVARWFHARGRFSDGVFLVDIRQAESAEAVVACIGAAMETCFKDARELRESLKARQALLILDNAEVVLWRDEPGARGLIDDLLRFCPGLRLLVTSQRQVGGNLHEPEKIVPLYPLPVDQARMLFLALAKRGLTQDEWKSKAFASLLDQLGGHPFSIALVARQLVHSVTIEDLIARVQSQKAMAIAVPGITGRDPEHGESLIACLSLAYQQLSQAARDAFAVLSMLPAGAQDFTLRQVLGQAAWESALGVSDASLAEILPSRRAVLLPPVQLFAEAAVTQEARQQIGPRVLLVMGQYAEEFYRHLAAADAGQFRRAFTVEEPNLRAAAKLQCPPPDPPGSLSVLGWLAPHLLQLYLHCDRVRDGQEAGHELLGALSKLHDKLGEGNTRQALGNLAMRTAELKDARAHYEAALDLFRQVEDKLGEGMPGHEYRHPRRGVPGAQRPRICGCLERVFKVPGTGPHPVIRRVHALMRRTRRSQD